ncbi:MAG: formate dehydrogenase accessory sulfurtransferase FdhD [Deltaproteobacteria bacterium]|nr:formate dehydrogenase accessory sulfurtransferase FdhD [Deltaproteobacteria bacterium]
MPGEHAAYVEEQKILVYRGNGFSEESVPVVQEVSLRICLNGTEMVTIACNGNYVGELAVGFLRSEGFIETASDIKKIEISDDNRLVHVMTKADISQNRQKPYAPDSIESSGARGWRREGAAPYRKDLLAQESFITPQNVFGLMERFVDVSRLHQVTGGTHSAALIDGDRILAVREDIGRHNTIDMLGGYTLLNGIDCSDKVIVRTGRISAEIVHKVWNLGVPVMISLSVPTSMAVYLCKEAGITLIGSVRGGRMNVYSHEWRIEK